jgi:hypothetical protein
LKRSSFFEASAKAISKQYNIAENSELLSALVDTFICDLEKRPVEWIVTAWLHGIEMEVDAIELEKGIIIRKPRSDDLEYEFPWFESLIGHIIPPFTKLYPPSAILEVKKNSSCLNLKPSSRQKW